MKKHLARLATKVAIVLALVGGALIVSAPAHAVTVSPVAAVASAHFVPVSTIVAAADAAPVVSFGIDWPIIVGLIVTVLLPLVVGLVTKVVTSSAIRAVLLAALAAVTGLLTELGNALTAGTTYNLGMGIVFALVSFITAVGLHFGLYKPVGASDAAKRALGGEKP